jgi:hypothetical protein
MPVQSQFPLSHSNQFTADSACGHCDGVSRHEPWCIKQNASVQYAYRAVSDPQNLSLGDHLILHALGAAWTTKRVVSKLHPNQIAGAITIRKDPERRHLAPGDVCNI